MNRLGLGAMRITGPGIWGTGRPGEARALLLRAVELGVDFIDTADSYGPETSEVLIAEALHPYPAGWSSRPRAASCARPVSAGTATAGPSTCGKPAKLLRRLKVERSTCTSCTRSTNSCRSRTPWANCTAAEGRQDPHIGLSNITPAQLAQARTSSTSCPCRTATTSRTATRIGARGCSGPDRIHSVVAVVPQSERSIVGAAPRSRWSPQGEHFHRSCRARVAAGRSPVMLPIPARRTGRISTTMSPQPR